MDTLTTFKASLAWMAPAITMILGGSLLLGASMVLKGGPHRDVHGQRNGMAILSLLILVVAGFLGSMRQLPENLGSGLFRFDHIAISSERLCSSADSC